MATAHLSVTLGLQVVSHNLRTAGNRGGIRRPRLPLAVLAMTDIRAHYFLRQTVLNVATQAAPRSRHIVSPFYVVFSPEHDILFGLLNEIAFRLTRSMYPKDHELGARLTRLARVHDLGGDLLSVPRSGQHIRLAAPLQGDRALDHVKDLSPRMPVPR